MWVDFETLPDTSRTWIYQADRKILTEEKELITKELLHFTEQWAAHNMPLQSSFRILEDYFIVIAVNEENAGATGCSIDSSVRVLKHLSQLSGIDFFNRGQVPFLLENQIQMVPLSELKQKFTNGIWNGETTTFNTMAGTLTELRQMWRMPAGKSWVKRYMNNNRVSSIAE